VVHVSKAIQHADADVFTAIAHPIRRQLLDQLLAGDQSVNQLAEPFAISRPAISQHLQILREVGLVTEQRSGRERRYRLRAERLRDVHLWLQQYAAFWTEKLDALHSYLERNP